MALENVKWPMGNRIKELREARGWTQGDLATRVGTTQQQIGRLEKERRRLDTVWLEKIAAALEVRVYELLEPKERPEPETSDISVVEDSTVASISQALSARGLRIYRVGSDAVVDSGVRVGDLVPVDETPEAINSAETGDIVLVEAGLHEKCLLLRVLVRPSLVVTNRPSANDVIRLDNHSVGARIVGVLIR